MDIKKGFEGIKDKIDDALEKTDVDDKIKGAFTGLKDKMDDALENKGKVRGHKGQVQERRQRIKVINVCRSYKGGTTFWEVGCFWIRQISGCPSGRT